MQFSTLAGASFPTLHQAFLDAFSHYAIPFNLTEEELRYMLERRGFDPAISFGAWEGEELVGFIFNGRDLWNGKETAYDTGTGVVQAFQGQGIGGRLFDYGLGVLRESGIEQFLLEVLKSNEGAFHLYQKKGFAICNEYDCYVWQPTDFPVLPLPEGYQLKEASIGVIGQYESDWEIGSSWQNSTASIRRKADQLKVIEVLKDGVGVGYGIVEPHTGDIPQVYLRPVARRQGIATALMGALSAKVEIDRMKFINIKSGYVPFEQFFAKHGVQRHTEQYEMVMAI